MSEMQALAEELREYTAMKYAGDCKCGKCQLVPRALVERIYHTLNGSSVRCSADSEQPVAYRWLRSKGDVRWEFGAYAPSSAWNVSPLYADPQPALNEPQTASSPAEIAPHETLTSRLRGRARYLRNIGEVKSPELMEQAAAVLTEPQSAPTREEIEAAAKIVYDAMPFDGAGARTKPAWVPFGNSTQQFEARTAASAILALRCQAGSAPDPAKCCAHLWACTGCGTRKSMEQIKGEVPQAIACCPERHMAPLTRPLRADADNHSPQDSGQ